MENLSIIIGENLKSIRIKRNFSLDKLAEITNVSKSMLGQIERGESNPTVQTLWKIATGLKVSFSAFLEKQTLDEVVIRHSNTTPIIEANGKMRVYPLLNFDTNKNFEMFSIELDSGCNHISDPHDEGVEEYIIVTKGTLDLILNGETYALTQGNTIHFSANQRHIYCNFSLHTTCFQNIIFYPEFVKVV